MTTNFSTVDDYIESFPPDVQALLRELRAVIRAEAPGAAESISYGMPTYKIAGKPLVYFAAFKKHIGFYATPTGHAAFAADLAPYKQGRGSVQFPLGKPLPFDLVRRIVAFRVAERA
ncbi:iron chaperone [Flaviaesturariibacter amylovorans]|uniref:DUF1801 domain-containing protein n=1 Tax=Flaviaesturariibacter amylovorans TaxID=1084520 RepID=A0ABP8HVG1_9BACT